MEYLLIIRTLPPPLRCCKLAFQPNMCGPANLKMFKNQNAVHYELMTLKSKPQTFFFVPNIRTPQTYFNVLYVILRK
jgi:hypothetical protein